MFYHDDAKDAELNEIRNNATHFHVLSSETDPTTYAAAIAASIANFPGPTIGAPANVTGPDGRGCTIAAITDDDAATALTTATGTGRRWALIDETNDRLMLVQTLTQEQAMTQGNPFTMASLIFRAPDA